MSRRKPTSRAEFLGRVESWARKLRVEPRLIRVQRMTRKWASCSTKATLSFSTDLLGEEYAFQDYVIVHELLHLRVPNHGKLFRSLLTAYIPNWQNLSELRDRSFA
jgi:hypothetical protein